MLRDRTRLIERTRVKRNALAVLGKAQNKSEQAKEKDAEDEVRGCGHMGKKITDRWMIEIVENACYIWYAN